MNTTPNHPEATDAPGWPPVIVHRLLALKQAREAGVSIKPGRLTSTDDGFFFVSTVLIDGKAQYRLSDDGNGGDTELDPTVKQPVSKEEIFRRLAAIEWLAGKVLAEKIESATRLAGYGDLPESEIHPQALQKGRAELAQLKEHGLPNDKSTLIDLLFELDVAQRDHAALARSTKKKMLFLVEGEPPESGYRTSQGTPSHGFRAAMINKYLPRQVVFMNDYVG